MNLIEFLTEYFIEDQLFGSKILATSWEEAQKIADARGLGETVVGFIPSDTP